MTTNQTLPQDALECLFDVVTHYDDFLVALVNMKAAAIAEAGNNVEKAVGEAPAGPVEDGSYWDHQINVLRRMRDQAHRAVGAHQRSPKVGS